MTNYISDIFNAIKNYDSIGFDLDNTLYNQTDYDYIIYKQFFIEKGYSGSQSNALGLALLNLKKEKGTNYPFLFDDFIAENDFNFTKDELLSFYKFPPVINIEDKLLLRDILIRLKKMNKYLFLVTNGYFSTQYNKVLALNIYNYFDQIIVLSPEGELLLKPYSDIEGKLRNKGKTIYIGDQESDAEFAKNSGFDFYKIVL